jgi:hypothetical protein
MITIIDIVEKVRVNEMYDIYSMRRRDKLTPIQRAAVEEWRRMEHINRI